MGFFLDNFRPLFPSSIVNRDLTTDFMKLWKIISNQLDALRDVIIDLFFLRSIGDSVGQQLDNIGTLVKETRKGKQDVNYQQFLQIAAQRDRARGSVPSIIQIARLISNDQFFRLIPGHKLVSDVLDGNELLTGAGILDPGDRKEPAHYKMEYDGDITTLQMSRDLGLALDDISGGGISHQLEAIFRSEIDAAPTYEMGFVQT